MTSTEKAPEFLRGGLPTDPDVNRLFDRLGVPAAGTLITWEELCQILGLPKTSGHFRSVIYAWHRRLEREFNVLLKAVPGRGYEAMDGATRIREQSRVTKNKFRHIGRAARRAASTDVSNVPPELVRVRDHIVNVHAQFRLTMATAARQLKYPA